MSDMNIQNVSGGSGVQSTSTQGTTKGGQGGDDALAMLLDLSAATGLDMKYISADVDPGKMKSAADFKSAYKLTSDIDNFSSDFQEFAIDQVIKYGKFVPDENTLKEWNQFIDTKNVTYAEITAEVKNVAPPPSKAGDLSIIYACMQTIQKTAQSLQETTLILANELLNENAKMTEIIKVKGDLAPLTKESKVYTDKDKDDKERNLYNANILPTLQSNAQSLYDSSSDKIKQINQQLKQSQDAAMGLYNTLGDLLNNLQKLAQYTTK